MRRHLIDELFDRMKDNGDQVMYEYSWREGRWIPSPAPQKESSSSTRDDDISSAEHPLTNNESSSSSLIPSFTWWASSLLFGVSTTVAYHFWVQYQQRRLRRKQRRNTLLLPLFNEEDEPNLKTRIQSMIQKVSYEGGVILQKCTRLLTSAGCKVTKVCCRFVEKVDVSICSPLFFPFLMVMGSSLVSPRSQWSHHNKESCWISPLLGVAFLGSTVYIGGHKNNGNVCLTISPSLLLSPYLLLSLISSSSSKHPERPALLCMAWMTLHVLDGTQSSGSDEDTTKNSSSASRNTRTHFAEYERLARKNPSTLFLRCFAEYDDAPLLLSAADVTTLPTFDLFYQGNRVARVEGINQQELEELLERYQFQNSKLDLFSEASPEPWGDGKTKANFNKTPRTTNRFVPGYDWNSDKGFFDATADKAQSDFEQQFGNWLPNTEDK